MTQNRYSFGGDEHLFVECNESMSLEAFFKGLSMTNAIRESRIAGVTEICPANASFQIRFDPDRLRADDLLRAVKTIEAESAVVEPVISTRIIEIPVFYQDPWTEETLIRFRDRHQEPSGSDIAYAARINGHASVAEFIKAHSGSPWFVSMVGFVAGLPFMYQMVGQSQQIQVPKYLRPRTDTPRLTVGHGGCFAAIYSVRGAGGYQMFGITPMPIFDAEQKTSYLREFMVLFRPGDIVKFKPIGRDEYDHVVADVDAGRFTPVIREVRFDLREFQRDFDEYNAKLKSIVHDD